MFLTSSFIIDNCVLVYIVVQPYDEHFLTILLLIFILLDR